MNFNHCGLYFDEQRVHYIHKHNKRPPLDAAWSHLFSATPQDNLSRLQTLAFQYRLNADIDSGIEAVKMLPRFDIKMPLHDQVVLLQCYELLREHPQQPEVWSDDLHIIDEIDKGDDFINQLWRAVVMMAAGIVLEDEGRVASCAAFYKSVISDEIHPEGYLPKAVENYEEQTSLTRQLQAVQALVLMAEMADQIGLNLWGYDVRAVSVLTAVTYPLYYYFYPENWSWNGEQWKPSDGVPEEEAKAIFRDHAGFLEISNRRFDRPLKAIKLILDDLRPVHDLYCGGYTTLTHAKAERRGLFG